MPTSSLRSLEVLGRTSCSPQRDLSAREDLLDAPVDCHGGLPRDIADGRGALGACVPESQCGSFHGPVRCFVARRREHSSRRRSESTRSPQPRCEGTAAGQIGLPWSRDLRARRCRGLVCRAQGLFTAPAKPLRAEPRTAHEPPPGDLHDSFVPATREPVLAQRGVRTCRSPARSSGSSSSTTSSRPRAVTAGTGMSPACAWHVPGHSPARRARAGDAAPTCPSRCAGPLSGRYGPRPRRSGVHSPHRGLPPRSMARRRCGPDTPLVRSRPIVIAASSVAGMLRSRTAHRAPRPSSSRPTSPAGGRVDAGDSSDHEAAASLRVAIPGSCERCGPGATATRGSRRRPPPRTAPPASRPGRPAAVSARDRDPRLQE
jgi:hypothetical protein